MDEKVMRLQEMLNASRYTVAVTGAGISVAAGIGDFQHMNFPVVLQMSSAAVLKSAPEHYYKMARKAFLDAMFQTGPTIAHKKLAEYEQDGRLQGVITTNIDCLHSLAGSQNIAEIQGSFGVNQCLSCGKQYDDVGIWNRGSAPHCDCGGIIGAFPVFNHIGLFEKDVQKARTWISQAELVLIIGAQGNYSGVWYSYIRSSAKIVQINPKSTQFDKIAVLSIHQAADEIFSQLS